MAYYLKKTKKKDDIYYQVYESFYEKDTKKVISKSVKAIGLASKLFNEGIEDPEKYCKELIKEMNEKRKEKIEDQKEVKIGENPIKYFGHFIIQKLINKIDYKKHLNFLNYEKLLPFDLADFIQNIVFSKILFEENELKEYEEALPSLLNTKYEYNYEDIHKGIEFIGHIYEKIIECLNFNINKKYPFNTDLTYFDHTNFYFQFNQYDQLKRNPILSISLMFDNDLIPINMKISTNNQPKKSILSKSINDIENAIQIPSKTIYVCDKSLNSDKNMIESIESKNGYIFSKSFEEMNENDKIEILKDLSHETFKSHKLDHSNIAYISKMVESEYLYNDENNKVVSKVIKEKRVVFWNQEININDIHNEISNYIANEAKNNIDHDQIDKDFKINGLNIIVTSELDLDDLQIINSYIKLKEIEEDFEELKSEISTKLLDSEDINIINGHFLIGYISIVLIRLLQVKFFKNKYSIETILKVIRSLKCAKLHGEDVYINLTNKTKELEDFNDDLNLNLLNYYFKPKKLKELFE